MPGPWLGHQLVEGDGQFADPDTGGVVHGVADGRGGAHDAHLAEALGPMGLVYGSGSSSQWASTAWTSAWEAMWYWAKSWLTTWPNRGSSTLCSYSAIDIPWVIPPMSWERAVLGLMTRPTSNIPSSRVTRSSPVSSSTRTSANWAPKLCIA
ncbi:hypothetical protein SANT12839_024780 [Streptomyces antimycoticus]|uniref:Uncharacterized protein n=1 Tax=Streptomyces antimycoticus TaxID=68175 RepID=A0A4D4K4G2_9ACTN|nr:hypothetical protein SANT12839_024780 [Streptomyces antimycoticus]